MGFDVKWTSVKGMIQTEFETPTSISTMPNQYAEPGSGYTNELELWGPYKYDAGGSGNDWFVASEGVSITWQDILDYFTGASAGYPKTLCEFNMQQSTLAPTGGWVAVGLEGWIDGINLRLRPYKIIYDAQHAETKTEVGTLSEISHNDEALRSKVYAGSFYRNGNHYYGLGFMSVKYNNATLEGSIWLDPPEKWVSLFGGEPSGDPTSPEFGKKGKRKGGYNKSAKKKGTFDDTSDKITPSSAPTLSALSSNMVHAYKVTDAELNLVAQAMYPDLIFNATSITDALGSLFDAIFMSKYVDYILDLMILPINVPAPTTEYIKLGGKTLTVASGSGGTSHISSHRVSSQYIDVPCGSISIDEYWANFLDFSGTRVKLFLPYIGYVDIQPEYIYNGKLMVDYRFNVLDGSFICFVRSTSGHSKLDESMIGQYAGVSAMHIPLQSTDYSNKVSGLISSLGAVAAGAAGGGMSGAVGYGAAASMANTLIAKPASSHANGYNASSSFLSHRVPYLIMEVPSSQFSEKYPEETGLPLYVDMRIGDCVGLTVSTNAHLDTIPCSIEGKEEIQKLLADGIIV